MHNRARCHASPLPQALEPHHNYGLDWSTQISQQAGQLVKFQFCDGCKMQVDMQDGILPCVSSWSKICIPGRGRHINTRRHAVPDHGWNILVCVSILVSLRGGLFTEGSVQLTITPCSVLPPVCMQACTSCQASPSCSNPWSLPTRHASLALLHRVCRCTLC